MTNATMKFMQSCLCSGHFFIFIKKLEIVNDKYLKQFKVRVESMGDYNTCVLGKFPCLMGTKLKKLMEKRLMKAHPMRS